MANAEKTAVIEELTGKFNESSGAVLTEYRGLTVAQLSELRGNLKGNATFTVTKNTLAKVAATNAGLGDQVSPMLSGPSAIAFVDGDVAQAAKGLLDFAKANPLLVIKGGVLDGKALTAAEVGKLSDGAIAGNIETLWLFRALQAQLCRQRITIPPVFPPDIRIRRSRRTSRPTRKSAG